MSDAHRRIIIEATIEPLTLYRRGYARRKSGPFYRPSIIKTLVDTGALRKLGGWRRQVTARAA